jgi:hypothetical protein
VGTESTFESSCFDRTRTVNKIELNTSVGFVVMNLELLVSLWNIPHF